MLKLYNKKYNTRIQPRILSPTLFNDTNISDMKAKNTAFNLNKQYRLQNRRVLSPKASQIKRK